MEEFRVDPRVTTPEAQSVFSGAVLVSDDLERIEL